MDEPQHHQRLWENTRKFEPKWHLLDLTWSFNHTHHSGYVWGKSCCQRLGRRFA